MRGYVEPAVRDVSTTKNTNLTTDEHGSHGLDSGHRKPKPLQGGGTVGRKSGVRAVIAGIGTAKAYR